jgi:hypothetical protein
MSNGTTIMWGILVFTDGTILANQPDVVLHDKQENTCLPINTATAGDSYVNIKENEKPSKYKDLEIKVSRMWKVRTKIMPVIVGALGTKRMNGSDRLVAPRSSIGHIAAEDHTNEHCTHHA